MGERLDSVEIADLEPILIQAIKDAEQSKSMASSINKVAAIMRKNCSYTGEVELEAAAALLVNFTVKEIVAGISANDLEKVNPGPDITGVTNNVLAPEGTH